MLQTARQRRKIETCKSISGQQLIACLGSLAVKRVLGKDESPDSNSGLGLFEYSFLLSFSEITVR